MVGTSTSLVTVTTLLLSCFLPEAAAFWRLPCSSPVAFERADPLIAPGQVSNHLHTIMGGNGFDFSLDYNKARTSTCSSCSVKEDLSAYWTPTLFYAGKNGTFTPVRQNGGSLMYYLQRRDQNPNEKLYGFPANFRMIAGDPMLRSYTDNLAQRAVSYACLDYQVGGGPEVPYFPTRNCNNGLRFQVFFPSCWNGRDVDSADHKSHMAYPSGVNSGACPASHPYRTISLFYEILWHTEDFKDLWYDGKQPFVLSQGDPTGYGLHGDFVNGWDVNVLQRATDLCTDESGVIELCREFSFFTIAKQEDCWNPSRVNEATAGLMNKLPGCNPIQPGPGRAVQQTNCGATTTIGPPKQYHTDVSSRGWSYVGCYSDNLDNRLLPLKLASNDMTIERCVDYCNSQGQKFAGTQYANECFCGNTAPPADRAGAKCMTPCIGNANQMCGGPIRLSIYKKN